MTKPIIASGIIFLILLAWLLTMVLQFLAELSSHHPAASGKLNDYLSVVNTGMSNFYIIASGKSHICIDAGSSLKKAGQELAKLGVDPDSVAAVFLTHFDHDHVAALDLFKNAQIYLSGDEAAMILAKKPRFFGLIGNRLPASYLTLNDGNELNVGGITVRAIATPGHTPGSMSYLVNSNLLFTGDSLGLENGKVTVFTPHFFNMDEETAKASLIKLSQLEEITWLGTGHHGFTENFGLATAK